MFTKKHNTRAVLLMAYGSPESPDDVPAYFTHIRGGKRPSDDVLETIANKYRQVGGKTPLMEITRDQVTALQELLDKQHGAGRWKVSIGMKHWHPFIAETMKEMDADGITDVVAIALAPHYSRISIGGYLHAIDEANTTLKRPLNVRLVESWHTNNHLIACISKQLTETIQNKQVPVIFTAHSLPERINTWHDPYESQLLETARLVAKSARIQHWQFSFQSAGHTPEPWLGPDILDVLKEIHATGEREVVICSIGFVCDNLEILYDLDIEAKHLADTIGLTIHRVPMRNTHLLFIEALADLVT